MEKASLSALFRRRSNAAPAPRGDADIRKRGRVLVLVDRHVLAVPIGQRRGARRAVDAPDTADDDAVRVTLHDLLDLAIERRQRADEQRNARDRRHPLGTFETIGALQPALAGKAL